MREGRQTKPGTIHEGLLSTVGRSLASPPAVHHLPHRHYTRWPQNQAQGIPDSTDCVAIDGRRAQCAISPPIMSSNSRVLACMSATSCRLSTFRRIRGSVFEERRLKRHRSNPIESPSV